MGGTTPELYGIRAEDLAAVFRVSLKTAIRWKRGQTVPPHAVLMVLSRDLGVFAPEWRGWTVNGGDLVSPDGWCVNRNDALAVPLMHSQIAALRGELEKARRSAEPQLEEQPLPSDWEYRLA